MAIDLREQYDRIYRYCYFRLGSRVLAEDFTQEAFLRYYQHYEGLSGVAALKCLYTIARNLCMDEYRRERRTEPEYPPVYETTEEAVIEGIDVRAALQRLTQMERELLLLRYVNEVPVSVIAGMWGISRFAAGRRIAAAKRRFMEEIQREA